jgi:hypothetical protein
MRKKKIGTRWLLLLAGSVLICSGDHAGSGSEEPTGTELGENEGNPLQSGFVFHDGRYVEQPYRVNRKGLAVYINGTMVRKSLQWPPEDTHVSEDPGFPQGVSEDMTFDVFVTQHFGHYNRKWRYLHQNFPSETAVQKIREYYEALPFVREVTLKDDVTIQVTTRNGEERLIDVGPPPHNPLGDPPTKENAIREVDASRKHYERRLKQGYCLFLFSGGGELSFGDRKAMQDLPEAVDVLRSGKSKKEKLSELQRLKILPPQYPEAWESIVTNFQSSAQLEARIAELRKKSSNVNPDQNPSLEEEMAIKQKANSK